MTAEPVVSILLPHLREPANDAALRVALDCIVAYTDVDYELIVEAVSERRDIYRVINDMAARAKADILCPTNSDVFVGVNWIKPLLELYTPETIVSPIMVEPGAIGVHVLNYHRDFGRTPDTFRREEFNAFIRAGGEWREPDGRSWYYPSLIPKQGLFDLGGFNTAIGAFPAQVDVDFWDRWEASGRKFRRARSWVYHLQQWSFADRQAKEV